MEVTLIVLLILNLIFSIACLIIVGGLGLFLLRMGRVFNRVRDDSAELVSNMEDIVEITTRTNRYFDEIRRQIS